MARFKKGDQICVQWPNGHKASIEIISVERHGYTFCRTTDKGHKYFRSFREISQGADRRNNNLTDEVRSETLLCNSCDMPIKANDEKVRDPESDGEYMHVKCAVEESENEGFDDYMERRK
jgi:hypothetical protein